MEDKLIKEIEFHGCCTRIICFNQVFFQEGKIHVKSLCQSLGETYPKLYDGTCPELLQSIRGKNISIARQFFRQKTTNILHMYKYATKF